MTIFDHALTQERIGTFFSGVQPVRFLLCFLTFGVYVLYEKACRHSLLLLVCSSTDYPDYSFLVFAFFLFKFVCFFVFRSLLTSLRYLLG